MTHTDLLIIRYLKPIETLSESWFVKMLLALLATIWTMMTDIFATSGELLLLLFVAITLDFITGVIASKKKNVSINSLGFRQTLVKAGEYIIVLLLLAGISNTFKGDIPFVEYLVTWGYFFTITTEVKSVIENVSKGKESKVSDIWEYVMNKLDDKNNE